MFIISKNFHKNSVVKKRTDYIITILQMDKLRLRVY